MKIPETGNHQPVTGCQQQATSNRLPATGIQQPASRIQQPESSIQTGFTLLEVLIAMAIMAIVLISVYRLHSQTLSMAAATRFYTQAPLLAQSKMAQLETISPNAATGDSGDFGEKYPGYGWSVLTEDVSFDALGDAAPDLKRMDLTVTLNENDYAYTIRSYRMMSE